MCLEGDHAEPLLQVVGRVFSLVESDVVNEVRVFGHLPSSFLAIHWFGMILRFENKRSKHVPEASPTPPPD
jgi:hypothetical protein